MRERLESWLNDIWYRREPPPWPLRPLATLYGRQVERRRHSARPVSIEKPVVVVGNITAGGTGKTPLIIGLSGLLKAAGLKPGIISRGYGRRHRGLYRVNERSTTAEAGDEPLLIHRRAQVPVMVCEDRVLAAQQLAPKVDVLLADDGMQHHRLGRDLEICVVDGLRGFGNGWLLPAGPLREPLQRLPQMDFVVCNGQPADPLPCRIYQMQLSGGVLKKLYDPSQIRDLHDFSGSPVYSVAAIGNPGRFFDRLREAGLKVTGKAFPDHHRYRPEDFGGLTGRPIIITEKDAVKCAELPAEYSGADDIWYLPVTAEPEAGFKAEFVAKVKALTE